MGRPKHRIILADCNEDRRAVTRFVLETSGFFVIGSTSLYQAAELGSEEICTGHLNTLLLAYSPISQEFLLDAAATLDCPWVFIAPDSETGRIWPKMAEVLERVRIASARKRGPMKGMKRLPETVQPALAEACA